MNINEKSCKFKWLFEVNFRVGIIALLISLILVSCGTAGSGSHSKEEGNASEKPNSSMNSGSEKDSQKSDDQDSGGKDKEQEQTHEYISDARRVEIDIIDSAKLDISHVVFLDTSKISITCPTDIGEQRALVFDLEMKQAVKLPDNIDVIKRLDNNDLFVKLSGKSEYLILDSVSNDVKKAISLLENIDEGIDISPAGDLLTYVTDEGLFVSDLDFGNQTLLVPALKGKSVFDTEIARYPRWLDSNRIAYKTVTMEGATGCAIINRDGTSSKTFPEAKEATIYPLISGDYIARFDSGKGVALIDANSGGKKYITEALLEKEGFSFDKNGKWVSYYRLNKEEPKKEEKSGSGEESGGGNGGKEGNVDGKSGESGGSKGGESGGSKWTGRFEVVGTTNKNKLYEFETDKPNAAPIEDTVASPDGKFLLFTDMDKSGRRVLYRLDIDTESEKSESGKSESGKSEEKEGGGSE
ncbi:MAG: hypothetical protein GX257_07940 [Clostridiales bacterium]|nr:hypothetical protein [Clostridiales bacterium]